MENEREFKVTWSVGGSTIIKKCCMTHAAALAETAGHVIRIEEVGVVSSGPDKYTTSYSGPYGNAGYTGNFGDH